MQTIQIMTWIFERHNYH